MNNLNLDHDEARALHRIVRAMHDGECPRCHRVHASEEMRLAYARQLTPKMAERASGWSCPSCRFFITQDEADAVFAIFAPFMERNLEIFEKWRECRTDRAIPS